MGRLQLYIEGKPVNLMPEEKIPITLRTPFLGLGDGQPSGSFNFRIPLGGNNAEIADFPERLSLFPATFASKNFWINLDGIQVMEGVAEFNNTTETTTEVFLGTAVAAFYSRLQNTKLEDYSIGGPVLIGTDFDEAMDAIYNGGADVNHPMFYCFPVYNRWAFAKFQQDDTILEGDNLNFWAPKDDLTDTTSQANHRRATQNPFLWEFYPNPNPAPYRRLPELNEDPFITTPFLRLVYVLDKLFPDLGYILDENAFALHPELKHTAFYSNYDWNIDYPYDEFGAPLFTGDLYIDPRKFVPDRTVWDFIKDTEAFFNCTFVFNHYEKRVRIKMNDALFTAADAVDYSQKVFRGKNISRKNPARVKIEMRHAQDDILGVGCSYDEENAFITWDGSTLPVTGFVKNDIAYVTAGHAVRNFARYLDTDLFAQKNPVDKEDSREYDPDLRTFRHARFVGNPGIETLEEFNSGCSHLVMGEKSVFQFQHLLDATITSVYFRTPVTAVPIRSKAVFGPSVATFSLPPVDTTNPYLITIYRGIREGGTAYTTDDYFTANEQINYEYPYASSDLRSAYDDANDFATSLLMTNENRKPDSGLIFDFWENTISWMKGGRRMVSVVMEMSPDEFKDFDFGRLVRIEGILFLPVELRTDFGENGIGAVEVDLITV